jgi:glycosyltransferase involved in cell wall biosynthesis
MRALLVYPSLRGWGGIQQHGRHLAAALEKAGVEVAAETRDGRSRLAFAARLLRPARKRPDLVVVGHAHYAPLGWAAARGARLVVVLHGIEAWTPRAAMAPAVRAADRIICVSSVTAERATRAMGLDPARVEVIPNAVDTERFRPGPTALEEKLRDLPHPRLLTVARLDANERYKGVDQVLRAMTRLRGRCSYLIVGTGSDLPRLRALAAELGVDARFYGVATDDELPELYRACDRFVMPSRGEGFGYVFLEALASGLPVIAGNDDGAVDALEGGRLGTLVNPLDEAALAQAIDAAADPDAARLRRARVQERFGLDAWSARYKAALGVSEATAATHARARSRPHGGLRR